MPVNFEDWLMTNEDIIAHFKWTGPIKDTCLLPVINFNQNKVDMIMIFFSPEMLNRLTEIFKMCNS